MESGENPELSRSGQRVDVLRSRLDSLGVK